jgi:hypothetical protein
MRCCLTIGYDTNAGFIDMAPVAQDVVNLALVFNRYELEDVGEKDTGQDIDLLTHQPFGFPEDV